LGKGWGWGEIAAARIAVNARCIQFIPLADALCVKMRIIAASISTASGRLRHHHAAIHQRRDNLYKDSRKASCVGQI
jgi:hypothetical protein